MTVSESSDQPKFVVSQPPQYTEIAGTINRRTGIIIICVSILSLFVGGAGALLFMSGKKPDSPAAISSSSQEPDRIKASVDSQKDQVADEPAPEHKEPHAVEDETGGKAEKEENADYLTQGDFIEVRAGVPNGRDLSRKFGLSYVQVHQIVDSLKGIFDFKKSAPGHLYRISLDSSRKVHLFEYHVSPIEIYEVKALKNGTLKGRKRNIILEKKMVSAGGTITSSLYA